MVIPLCKVQKIVVNQSIDRYIALVLCIPKALSIHSESQNSLSSFRPVGEVFSRPIPSNASL